MRITLTLAPHGAKTYGVRLRTTDGERDGTEFCLTSRTGRAHFSVSTHSGSAGQTHGGPAIAASTNPCASTSSAATTWWTWK